MNEHTADYDATLAALDADTIRLAARILRDAHPSLSVQLGHIAARVARVIPPGKGGAA